MRYLGLVAGLLALAGAQSVPAGTRTPATPSPAVTYSREFKGSQPYFFTVELAQSGLSRYEVRETADGATETLTFTATPALVTRVFALAAACGDFAQPLEDRASHVGYTGTKTLAWQGADGDAHSQQFNNTRVREAQQLVDLFEKIAAAGEDAVELKRSARYDPLGALDVLDRIQQDWQSNSLLEPQLLEPVLQNVADNPALMGVARTRANQLLAKMAPKS